MPGLLGRFRSLRNLLLWPRLHPHEGLANRLRCCRRIAVGRFPSMAFRTDGGAILQAVVFGIGIEDDVIVFDAVSEIVGAALAGCEPVPSATASQRFPERASACLRVLDENSRLAMVAASHSVESKDAERNETH